MTLSHINNITNAVSFAPLLHWWSGTNTGSFIDAASRSFFLHEIINNPYVQNFFIFASVAAPPIAFTIAEEFGISILCFSAISLGAIALIASAGYWIYQNNTWLQEKAQSAYNYLFGILLAKKGAEFTAPLIQEVKKEMQNAPRDIAKGVVQGIKNVVKEQTGVDSESTKPAVEQVVEKATKETTNMLIEGARAGAAAAGGAIVTATKSLAAAAIANPVTATVVVVGAATVAAKVAYDSSPTFKEVVDQRVIDPMKKAHDQTGKVLSQAVDKTLDGLEVIGRGATSTPAMITAALTTAAFPPATVITLPLIATGMMINNTHPSPPPLADPPALYGKQEICSTTLAISQNNFLPEITDEKGNKFEAPKPDEKKQESPEKGNRSIWEGFW